MKQALSCLTVEQPLNIQVEERFSNPSATLVARCTECAGGSPAHSCACLVLTSRLHMHFRIPLLHLAGGILPGLRRQTLCGQSLPANLVRVVLPHLSPALRADCQTRNLRAHTPAEPTSRAGARLFAPYLRRLERRGNRGSSRLASRMAAARPTPTFSRLPTSGSA